MRISDWSSDVCSSDLAGDGPCQESLPCPRRTDQQHAFRCCPAKPGVFLRPLEEVDDFHQLVLRLVDPSDVRKGDLRLRFFVKAPRLARSEVRMVGKVCVSTCRFRWSPYHSQQILFIITPYLNKI